MEDYEVVAINDLTSPEMLAHLLKYDSCQKRYELADKISYEEGAIIVDGKKIPVYANPNPEELPWKEHDVDVVLECTGFFTSKEKSAAHIKAGAKKVIISAPAKDKVTPTFVYGVNHDWYKRNMNVVSTASCTTNCLAPICKVINDNWGIYEGLLTTIHSTTGKQKTNDGRTKYNWRMGRSVFNNIIPTTTGAAKAVALVIPELEGAITGMAFRIPAVDVSAVDLDVVLRKAASLDKINKAMKEASETYLKDVLLYTDEEVTTIDFVGCSAPSVYDAKMGIEVNDKFFKLVGYYDNEYGYTSNMLRMVRHMYEVDNSNFPIED
jgi:glyceraldehyde 3-phosphate dehydrogenase